MMSEKDQGTARGAAENVRTIALRYIGGGAALPDVPARDLSDDELGVIVAHLVALSEATATEESPAQTAIQIRKALIASGLYEKAGS
jgi:hypothetical protein